LFSTNAVAFRELATGTHEITLRLDDGHPAGTSRTSVLIEVISPCEGVRIAMDLVNDRVKFPGAGQRPLLASLEAACASFDRQDAIAGVNQLGAFQNKVRAQITPLDQALADTLIRSTQTIMEAFRRE